MHIFAVPFRVPRDHVANTRRSEDDVLKIGYEVIQSDTYTN